MTQRPLKIRFWDPDRREWIYDGYADLVGSRVKLQMYKDLPSVYSTGLKDKNGKEIWEGDVVKHLPNYEPFPVIWDEQSGGFFLARHAELEVIGNIYENPELLKL